METGPTDNLARFVFQTLWERAQKDERGAEPGPDGPTWDGPEVGPEAEVLEALAKGHDHPAIPELFARGMRLELDATSGSSRLSFLELTARAIAWNEEHGPWGLSRAALAEITSSGDRVALKVGLARELVREANDAATTVLRADPWILPHLASDKDGVSLVIPMRRQARMARRVDELLEDPVGRWDAVDELTSSCQDPWILRYLCGLPQLFEHDEVAVSLLAHGDHRQVSCGIYALDLAPEKANHVAGRVLEHIAGMAPAEAAARVLDIYAQLWLNHGRPESLRAGLLNWARGQLHDSTWLGSVFAAAARDPRSLRQVFFFADLADLVAYEAPAAGGLLYQQVVRTWLASFTPRGVIHPLADKLWQERVGESMAWASRLYPELPGMLRGFGLDLPGFAESWAESFPEEARGLATRLVRLFGSVVRRSARAVWFRTDGSDEARAWYRTLLEVYCRHRSHAGTTGAFGAIEHILPKDCPGEEAAETLLQDAAAMDLRSLVHSKRPVGPERWLPGPSYQDLLRSEAQAVHGIPTESEAWDGSEIQVLPASPEPPSPLPTILGVEALETLMAAPLALLGRRRVSTMRIHGNNLVLTTRSRLLGVTTGTREIRIPLHGAAVRVERFPRARVLNAAGFGVLLAGSLYGTSLLFDGLEHGDGARALAAIGVVAAALLYDATCHFRHLTAMELVRLVITPPGAKEPVVMALPADAASAVLTRLT